MLIVAFACIGIGVAERCAAVAETDDREEQLQRALLVELIGDDRCYLRAIHDGVP